MPLEQAKVASEVLSEDDKQDLVSTDQTIREEVFNPFTDTQVEQMMDSAGESWFDAIDLNASEVNSADANSPWQVSDENQIEGMDNLNILEQIVDDSGLEELEDNPHSNFESIDHIEW